MSGWIKMGVNLRNHPKVVRMSSALKADRLRVVGGLWAVWCVFDAHSPDGKLDGYTLAAMDEEIGWKGFSKAMAAIAWLIETADGLEAPDYDEHNGPSAKRRALDTKRKNDEREADRATTKGGQLSASKADKDRTRGEERRGDSVNGGRSISTEGTAASVCRALAEAGIPNPNASNITLIALLEAGATPGEFLGAVAKSLGKQEPFTYLLSVVDGQRRDAAKVTHITTVPSTAGAVFVPPPPLTEAEKAVAALALKALTDKVHGRTAA